jgi:uncharacterized membrane protein
MATYHFTWDLEYFRYVDPGTATAGPMKWYARAIASTFLILAGVSLVLAHAERINWRGFAKRFAMVAGAAALISLGTWYFMGRGFIFFGILHQIAFGTLIGLAFLRLPSLIILFVSAGMIAAPFYLRSAVFDAPVWWWLGLSSIDPPSNDYVPVLPWTGMILIGIAVTNFAVKSGLLARLATLSYGAASMPGIWFGLAGRHSLTIYLIHQPLLISCVYLFSLLAPAPAIDQNLLYASSCKANCETSRDSRFCQAFCRCVKARIEEAGLFDDLMSGKLNPQSDPNVLASADICTAEAERNGQ